jgi:hypothetical protein
MDPASAYQDSKIKEIRTQPVYLATILAQHARGVPLIARVVPLQVQVIVLLAQMVTHAHARLDILIAETSIVHSAINSAHPV